MSQLGGYTHLGLYLWSEQFSNSPSPGATEFHTYVSETRATLQVTGAVITGGKDGHTSMDLMQTSEEWSKTHFVVNDLLSEMLNELRNLGYNPSYHVSYDQSEHHIVIDPNTLSRHPKLTDLYDAYVQACNKRDEAVEKIRSIPKIDLGF